MGLGDEIMALGRAERIFEETGKPVSIITNMEVPRDHDSWHGNPAWVKQGGKKMIDCGGYRPYIRRWHGRTAIFNPDYRPRAGVIFLTEEERAAATLKPPYAIVAPHLKSNASPNKDWGAHRWEKVIKDFPCPVYQLLPDDRSKPIAGAIPVKTPSFRVACAIIQNAAVVMCNEGGTHHMAAAMRTPAVVVFGSFVPPQVTGYDYHYNIAVQTDEGYCGKWDACEHCRAAMKTIDPLEVREKAILMMESYDAD